MTLFRQAALLLAVSAAPVMAAPSFEDIGQLEGQLVAALGAGIGEDGGPLRPIDRRLKLTPCPEPVVISSDDLGAASLRCKSIGWRIRVPLLASLTPAVATAQRRAKAEPVVRKGDQVELSAAGAAFTVSTTGIAEQDGAPGDRIRVRSDGKATRITGQVSSDGRVLIAGFK